MTDRRLKLLERERRIKAKLAKIAAGNTPPPAGSRRGPYAKRAIARWLDEFHPERTKA